MSKNILGYNSQRGTYFIQSTETGAIVVRFPAALLGAFCKLYNVGFFPMELNK